MRYIQVSNSDREQDGGYQEMGGGRKRKLLNGYRVSDLQDENVLKMFTTMGVYLTPLTGPLSKWLR